MSQTGRGRKTVTVLVVLAVLAALSALGLWMVKGFGLGPSESLRQNVSFDEPVTKLVLDGDTAELSLSAVKGDSVEITKTLRWTGENKPATHEEVSGDTLTVEERGCDGIKLWDNCRVEYDITLPADVTLDLSTDSGDVATSGISADQSIALDSGNVTVADATGDLKVDSDSGRVNATGLGGERAEISNDSGSVALEYAKAPERVDIVNDSGDLDVTVPDDGEHYRVDAQVSSGHKDVAVPESADAARDITARTDSGSVSVTTA